MKTYLLAGLALATSSNAAVINVPADYSTIQEAIGWASSGDTVLVAPGEYVESVWFGWATDVDLVASGSAENTTILRPNSSSGSTLSLTHGNTGCSIKGFTIRRGTGESHGGGLRISGGGFAIQIVSCVFEDNTAEDGGGAYVAADSTASFVDCIFRGNSATNDGGGLCIRTNGGFTVDRCRFESNTAGHDGGGAAIGRGSALSEGETPPRATNCVFVGNEAIWTGGGIHVIRAMANIFYYGGVYGCSFRDNTARYGGAIYDGSFSLFSHLAVRNCILRNNEGQYDSFETLLGPMSTSPSFNYCCLDTLGPGPLTNGNTAADPRFVHGYGWDLRLQPGSPCIDAGFVYGSGSEELNGDYGIAGGVRRLDCTLVADTGSGPSPIVDIGAYEFDEDDINGWVALPDPNGSSGASIDIASPGDWWDGVLPHFTIPTWLDGDLPMDIAVGSSTTIGTLYSNSGDVVFWHAGGASTPTISVAEYDGQSKALGVVIVGAFEGESPRLTLRNVDLACDVLGVLGGVFTIERGDAAEGPTITATRILVANAQSVGETRLASELAFVGTGTITQASSAPEGYYALGNAAVVQPTGPLVVNGSYVQTNGEDIFSAGTLRFDMTSLDQALIINGLATLGGAVHFALDPDNPPALNDGDTVVLLTATDGFVEDSTFDYAITSDFANGLFFSLSHNSSLTGGSTVTATVQSTDEILFGDGETDTSGVVSDAILADVNGDTFDDLILSVPSIDSIVMLLNEGTTGGEWDGFDPYGNETIVIGVGSNPTGLTSGDFNGDGDIDIAVANTGDGTVSILINNGVSPTPWFAVDTFPSAPHLDVVDQIIAEPLDVYVGDLDSDGWIDLAVTNAFDGLVVVFQNTGVWFNLVSGMGAGNNSDPGGTIRKFDPNGAAGKGRDDQVWGSSSTTSTVKTARIVGSGVGPGIFLEWTSYATDLDPVDIGVGDLNGDGDQDVVTVNESAGSFSVLLGDGEDGQDAVISFAIGAGARSVDLGDLDGDGDIDIAVVCEESGGDRVVRIIKNMLVETGVFGLVVQLDDNLAGQSPFLVNVGDVDNDGGGTDGANIADIVALTNATAFINDLHGFISELGELGGSGSCDADLSGDGLVDAEDLGLVLAGWGTSGDSDINGDRTTDGTDLALVLAAWGSCGGEV